MNREEALYMMDIVSDMNTDLYEAMNSHIGQNGTHDDYEYPTVEIDSNGDIHMISFMGIMLWNSEEDEREFIDAKNDYEPLKPFLNKKINELIDKTQKMRIVFSDK